MRKLYIFALFTIICSSNTNSQSKLKKAEESLKKEETTVRKSTKKSNRSSTYSDGSFFEETIGRFFIDLFLYTGYAIMIESPYENESPSNSAILTKHPYFNSNNGNYSYEWNESSVLGRTTISSKYIFENSRINGNHLNIDMRFLKRIALEVDYLQLWEDNLNFGHHKLAIYTALAKYHRVRTQQFDAWWGLGTSYIDGDVNDWGFTYGLGVEVFLGKPISFESVFNQTLINDETVNRFDAVLNYHINKHKLTGGYEHLKIGSQKFATVLFGIGVNF